MMFNISKLSIPDPRKEACYRQLFFILAGILLIVFFAAAQLTGGYSMRGLFVDSQQTTYMDFFNSVLSLLGNPYKSGAIMTPFAYVIYKIFLMMIPEATIKSEIGDDISAPFTERIKIMQEFWGPFIFYSLLLAVAIYVLVFSLKKGRTPEKLAFLLVTLLSAPMLFSIERASSVLVSFVLVFAFMVLNEKEKKWQKEIGLVCLALAAAFSMYPIIYILVLIKEKRPMAILRVIVYAIVATAAPLIIFHAKFAGITALFSNYILLIKQSIFDVSGGLPFYKMLMAPLSFTPISDQKLLTLSIVFGGIVSISAITGIICKRKTDWKAWALIACLLAGLLPTSDTHMLVFFIIPLIMMIDSDDDPSVKNYIYVVLFVLITGLFLSGKNISGEYTRFISTKISSYAMLIMTIMLTIDSLAERFIKTNKVSGGQQNEV